MKKRLVVACCFTWFALVFLPTEAFSEIFWEQGRGSADAEEEMQMEGGKIHIGKLAVIPSLGVSGVYDDNIFLANGYTNDPNNPGTTVNGKLSRPLESDYIFQVNPGLLIKYDMGERGSAKLGYLGDWAFYRDFTVQNWNMQRAFFNFDYTAPAGLIFKFDNLYANGNDPYGDATQYGLGYNQQRWTYDLTAQLGWNFFNRFRVIGYGNFYKQEYQDQRNASQNWSEYKGGIGFEMRVLPKTWAFLQFDYVPQNFDTYTIDSSKDASNKKYNTWGGLKWDGGGKLGGMLGLGWQWLYYNNDVDPAGVPYENRNTWMANTSINYQATATTGLDFNLARGILATGGATNEYYDNTTVGINVNQDLAYKFKASGGLSYGRNDYNTLNSQLTEDRVDNNYNAIVGISYEIRSGLGTTLQYHYMKKDSNDQTQGFTDQQISLRVYTAY